jgi:hypothetical protein
MNVYRYPWPASALTQEDMATLHAVRENGRARVPITQLIAEAVRRAYAQAPVITFPQPTTELKEAA